MLRKPRRRRGPSAPYVSLKLAPAVILWFLRILVPLGGSREFIRGHGFANDALADSVGLGEWADPMANFDEQAVRIALHKAYKAAEAKADRLYLPTALLENVARLAQLANLSVTDCRILEFAVVIRTEPLLDEAADYLGGLSSEKVCHVLSVLLDLPLQDIRTSLNLRSTLAQSGLLNVDRSNTYQLRGKLNLISEAFAEHISSPGMDPIHLLRDRVSGCSPAQLTLEDYAHLSAPLAILRPYLSRSAADSRKGVNIFLHGRPGTGKSQLARALAENIACELFEIATEDSDGNPISGDRRLRAFRAGQCFLARQRALLLFDEVEDVFNDGQGFFGSRSTAQLHKGWVNRMLEENPVPTLWLSNSVRALDPAFIRRFDMVVELSVPPKPQREHIIRNVCGDFLDAPAISRFAESERLMPAVVTRAASVVNAIRGDLADSDAGSAFELLINGTLEAQGHRPVLRENPARLPAVYDPAHINADADLTKVARGLRRSKTGRLCLYGPPGTGKTAYARWLASELAMPLHVQRASDLMSKWVGDNEKNIARAYRDAGREGAILLIDEVDSFLQDRRSAERSWEVTLVNEMLTQMESFAGILIASTNLMEGLDQAAMRRFDLKVKFDFLRPEQAWALFKRHCEASGVATPSEGLRSGVQTLVTLTPGDFATVARQGLFRPVETAEAFLAALFAECQARDQGKSKMGFATASVFAA